jgi:uncharacterized protein (TIGR02145 family)
MFNYWFTDFDHISDKILEHLMKIFYIVLFLLFSSLTYSQSPCPGLDSINYSGQLYHTVQIGSQCWLKENLNVGIMKPAVKDQINNDTIEKYCYNNDPANCNTYGGLYQWREAMRYTKKQGARGICPIGWHIPIANEFGTLKSSVGLDGNALKEVGQGGGTNTSGFSALLSGINIYTAFHNVGVEADYWTTYAVPHHDLNLFGTNLLLSNNTSVYLNDANYAEYGLSIRCVKDSDGLFLQSPYGGEIWQVGTVHQIYWGGNLVNKIIKIEYSTDNGISWIQITDNAPAGNGSFDWTIPGTPSKNCKVRVSDIDNPNSLSMSDTIFTINNDPCSGMTTIQHGGKTYNIISIGGKCLFKENLNIGTMIPGTQEPANNGILEKYCYNNDTNNCSVYGGLYSYKELIEKGFCPTFWHSEGLRYLVGNVISDGNALKDVGQGSGFGSGTNTSGFSALLAGTRWYDGSFLDLGVAAYFPYDIFVGTYTFSHSLDGNSNNIGWTDQYPISAGSSYRCTRDDLGPLTLKSPIGGENWQVGSTQKITWPLTDVINIKIDYTTNNGTNWINIIPSIPTSAASFNWTIPNTPSTNCKVKISSTNNSDTNSISNLFQIYQVPTNPCPGIPTVNFTGQTYNTIAIGDQCWMRENLNIGTMIDSTQTQTNNGIIEKYCYRNDSVKCSIYGGLYQWDEVMQYSVSASILGICPTGWHIPTKNDYLDLITNVNNNGNDLKAEGQGSDLGSGTNASGFSAILSGARLRNGNFGAFGTATLFWSSTVDYSNMAFYLKLINSENSCLFSSTLMEYGYSVRCINDLNISQLPVELTSFIASLINNRVNLNWNTATEINAASFEVEKKMHNNNNWQKIGSVNASGNSSSSKHYAFSDKKINTGKYNYRLKMVDLDGSYKYSNIVNLEVTPPAKFELSNAYPNPWNPSTTIRFQVPVNILVTIKMFDAVGREVATLINEIKPAGSYEVILNGRNLASGVYYYQMKAGSFLETKKFILIK